jgi:hypothetical protein
MILLDLIAKVLDTDRILTILLVKPRVWRFFESTVARVDHSSRDGAELKFREQFECNPLIIKIILDTRKNG